MESTSSRLTILERDWKENLCGPLELMECGLACMIPGWRRGHRSLSRFMASMGDISTLVRMSMKQS